MPNVIEEFLVGLVFKIDTTGSSKFFDVIQNATVKTGELGLTLEGVTRTLGKLGRDFLGIALSIEAGMGTVLRSFGGQGFAADRIGASVSGLNALSYALKQHGIAASEAGSAVTAFSQALMYNPGLQSLATNLLGHALPADRTQAFMELLGRLQQMPRYLQQQYAGQFGIPLDILQTPANQLQASMAQYGRIQGQTGVNVNALAQTGEQFSQTFGEMTQRLAAFSDKMAQTFGPRMVAQLQGFNTFLQSHAADINAVMGRVGNAAVSLIDSVGKLASAFSDLTPHTQHLIELASGLGSAWIVFNRGLAATPMGMLLSVAAALLALWTDYQSWKAGSAHFIDWDTWAPEIQNVTTAISNFVGLLKQAADALIGQGGWQSAAEVFAAYMAGRWLLSIAGSFAAAGLAATGFGSKLSVLIGLGAAVAASLAWAQKQVGDPSTWPRGSPFWQGMPESEQQKYPNSPLNTRGQPTPFSWMNPNTWFHGGTTPMPQSDSNPLSGSAAQRANALIEHLVAGGMSMAEAQGVVATQIRESGLDPAAVNPSGATGLSQWLGSRLAELKAFALARHGSYLDPYLQEDFTAYELQHGEAAAGQMFANARSPADYGQAGYAYERPGTVPGYVNDIARNFRTLQGWQAITRPVLPSGAAQQPQPATASPSGKPPHHVNVSNSPNITVSGIADPQSAANKIADILDRTNGNLIRNLSGVLT